MKVEDMSVGMTIDVEAMEVEVDSLGIETTDHVNPSNVSHVIRMDIQNTTVDKTSADRTFDSCRLNVFATFSKSMETTRQNISHSI